MTQEACLSGRLHPRAHQPAECGTRHVQKDQQHAVPSYSGGDCPAAGSVAGVGSICIKSFSECLRA